MRVRLELAVPRILQRLDRRAEPRATRSQFRFREQFSDEFSQNHGEGHVPAFELFQALRDRFFVHASGSRARCAESIA
jgi:hypothetical protein